MNDDSVRWGRALSDQTLSNKSNSPITGFVARTSLLTPSSHKLIADLKPGDLIQTKPDDDQGDDHDSDERRL
jgi:hypothetical protein